MTKFITKHERKILVFMFILTLAKINLLVYNLLGIYSINNYFLGK